MEEFIEGRIITGLVVSLDYVSRIRPVWNSTYITSPELRKIATWCIEYYDKYETVPGKDIQAIIAEKINSKAITGAEVEYIQQALSNLSREYERANQFNSSYLFDQTIQYFKSQHLLAHNRRVQSLINQGKVEEAEKLMCSYSPGVFETVDGVDLPSEEAWREIERAFDTTLQQVITYPGALGEMWNDQLVRGALVGFLAPEKRGKTFWLLELAMRAIRQRANVAFFEAGDMTEAHLLKRICIYLARRNDREQYCSAYWRAVGDCVLNQLNLCNRPERNCNFGVFEEVSREDYLKNWEVFVDLDMLVERKKNFPDYSPCDASTCEERIGTVWIERRDAVSPLKAPEAVEIVKRFFEKTKRRLKIHFSAADTLDVNSIRTKLDEWERFSGFVPDVVIVDYADLLAAPVQEFRHRQDYIWKKLRALSQEKHCLVLTATQADAESYSRSRLSLSNFSEDKRKYAHVTAMYGLNQDPEGREKRLGLMRINELVVRESEFFVDREVFVIYDFREARAFLEGFQKKRK